MRESHSNTGVVALLFYVLLCALLYCHLTQEGTMCSSWNAPGCLGPSVFQTQLLLLGLEGRHPSTSAGAGGGATWSSHLGSQQREWLLSPVNYCSHREPPWVGELPKQCSQAGPLGLLCGHPLPSVWEVYCESGNELVEPGESFLVFSLNHKKCTQDHTGQLDSSWLTKACPCFTPRKRGICKWKVEISESSGILILILRGISETWSLR